MIAVIKGHPDAVLGSDIQQALPDGILAHRVDGPEVGKSSGDRVPGASAIVRAEEIRMLIVDPEPADRCVRGLLVKVRSRDLRDLAPWS